MKRKYYSREELIQKYTTKISEMLKNFKDVKPMSIEELKAASAEYDNLYIEKLAELAQLRKKVKNSTILKGHFRKKFAELREQVNTISSTYDSLTTAVELCEIFDLKDTTSLLTHNFNESDMSKIVDYKVQQEKEHNEEVEKTGTGRKSQKYSKVDEKFNEEDYAIFDVWGKE